MSLLAPFSRPFPKVDFLMHFGRPWAHLWLPFGSPWLVFGALWLTLGSLWLHLPSFGRPFGSNCLPFGSLLSPSGSIFSLLTSPSLNFLHFQAISHKHMLKIILYCYFSCKAYFLRRPFATNPFSRRISYTLTVFPGTVRNLP